MGRIRAAAVFAVLGSVLAIGAAVASGAPAGGAVHVYGVPKGGGGTIMFTGAIGDFGKVQRENANGTANTNGNFVKFDLKQGTFVGDATGLFAKLNSAKPVFDKTTCSGAFTAAGPITLGSGTGHYTGITGTLHVRATFAFVGARFKSGKHKGQCNTTQNSAPLAQYGAIAGSGRVSFG